MICKGENKKGTKTERLVMRMTPEEKRKAKELADEYGIPITNLIIMLITKEYKKIKNPS